MTTKKRNELLTFGYVHENCVQSIPDELSMLIKLFYDEHFYWHLNEDEMHEFFVTKNKYSIESDTTININDVIFKCEVYPNGCRSSAEGAVQLCSRLTYLPDSIECIALYAELNCQTTATQFKFAEKFTAIDSTFRWRDKILKLEDCKQYKTMDFICLIRIMDIKFKYQHPMNDNYYINSLKMQPNIIYKWSVDTWIVREFKKIELTKFFYSDNFNGDNWCLAASPADAEHMVCLKCLLIPIGLKWIETEFRVKCCDSDDDDDVYDKISHKFGGRQTFTAWAWLKKQVDFVKERLENEKEIDFVVEMNIVNLYDDQDDIVKPEDWGKYGILN